MQEQKTELLTVAQLAVKFNVSRVNIRHMVMNDSIPCIFIDKQPYFNEEQINVWREELIKERYDQPIKRKLLIIEKERLEYYQNFKCMLCEYESKVAVYNDDTVYGIVEKIKRAHRDGSPDCSNDIQDMQISRED